MNGWHLIAILLQHMKFNEIAYDSIQGVLNIQGEQLSMHLNTSQYQVTWIPGHGERRGCRSRGASEGQTVDRSSSQPVQRNYHYLARSRGLSVSGWFGPSFFNFTSKITCARKKSPSDNSAAASFAPRDTSMLLRSLDALPKQNTRI